MPTSLVDLAAILVALVALAAYFKQRYQTRLEEKSHEVLGRIEAAEIEQSKNSTTMGRLREYAQSHSLVEYDYVDVVLFGPRASGKTSIASLWTSPWTQIGTIRATEQWRTYESNIYEYPPENFHDDLFQIGRTRVRTLRLRVQDYPGEVSYRLQAIKDLKELNTRVVALFVMRVGYANGQIGFAGENAEYFSIALVDEIADHLQSLSRSVAMASVIFNKADLLPTEWNKELAIDNLKAANRDAVYNLNRVFSGKLQFHLTSAASNRGLISLLGAVAQIGVDAAELPRITERIGVLEKEFEPVGRSNGARPPLGRSADQLGG